MPGNPQNHPTPFDIFFGTDASFQDCLDLNILKDQLSSLTKAKELLYNIIQSTQDAIFIVDENGTLVLVNTAYTKLVGLPEERLLNQPTTIDIPEGFESVSLKVLASGKPIKEVYMKLGLLKRDVIASVAPIVIRNEIKGCVGVIQDVSVIRRLSEELRNANKLLMNFDSKYSLQDIIGASLEMAAAKNKAFIAASTKDTVLLLGESGTGKELFAHAIHHASERHNKAFIRVNCAAIPGNLMESELFGYSEGSFSGAKKGGRMGYFEEANGGTLFLDEIGDMPIALQPKLLRAIQESEIIRLGESKPREINVRIIAATNANLERMIQAKQFRSDLYYRLNVLPIYVPSLKEIKEDIPEIAKYLAAKICKEYGRLLVDIDRAALDYLKNAKWPGNVRELESGLRRAIINMQLSEETMKLEHILISDHPFNFDNQHIIDYGNIAVSYEELKEAWEKELFTKVLAAHNGNKTKAARSLGMSIRNLYQKITKYHLDGKDE